MSEPNDPNIKPSVEVPKEIPMEPTEIEIPADFKSPTTAHASVPTETPKAVEQPSKSTEPPKPSETVTDIKPPKPAAASGSAEPEKEETMDLKENVSKKFALPQISIQKILGFLLNFLVPLASLSISGILAILVFIPSYRDIPSLEASLATKTQLASQLEHKVSSLKELVDFSSQVEEYSLVVNKALISEPKVPELLAQIDLMVRESGLEVSSLNYSQASSVEAEGMSLIDVSLSTTGSFEELVAFLKNVENASRLVLLKDFRYSVSEKDGVREVSTSFQLQAPFLFVSSSAVTDDPIDLSISSAEFLADMQRILDLRHYELVELTPVEPLPEPPVLEEPVLTEPAVDEVPLPLE